MAEFEKAQQHGSRSSSTMGRRIADDTCLFDALGLPRTCSVLRGVHLLQQKTTRDTSFYGCARIDFGDHSCQKPTAKLQ